jgi:hypothetical protein
MVKNEDFYALDIYIDRFKFVNKSIRREVIYTDYSSLAV